MGQIPRLLQDKVKCSGPLRFLFNVVIFSSVYVAPVKNAMTHLSTFVNIIVQFFISATI